MASYKRVILQSDNISDLTNDAGYITSVGDITWNSISGKPSIFMHDYATVTGNPTFAGTNTFSGPSTFTGTTIFQNTSTQIYNSTAWSGKPALLFKFPGAGGANFYGNILLSRQGSSGYNSQLEFQTSIYNNNVRTVMTLNSAGSLHLDGTVYANGVIGKNSGGFAIGSIADYNRIDFQSGTFRTLFANGSIAPLQVGDLTASTINGNISFDANANPTLSHGANPTIRLTDTTNTTYLDLRADDTGALIRSTGNHPLRLNTNQADRLTIASNGEATFSHGVSVKNSFPYLYVGDNVNNNSGSWDANIFLDSHANARLRIQQRSDAKNLELWVHGGYEPLIQATDSANYLRLGVGGNVGLELGKYSVYLRKATYVESLRANNSSGLITIYNQGYGSKGNLELNNITGAESTFTTRVNTGQIRFTDGSKTSFNHLNVSQWHTAYTWGDHSQQGYLKVDSSNHLTIQGHYYDSGNQKVATENHVSVNYAPKVNPVFSGQVKIDSNNRLIGGFGAVTTAGTTDWNHDSNAISGQGYTLLLGGATNGHGFDNDYYHPFNFEYARNDGYGNMTQLAVPYSDNGAFAFRTRYSGNWSGWRRIIDTGIISAYADKTPSWVPSSDPGYLTSFNISGTGSSIGTTTGHNFHIKTNNQYRISITDQGVVTIPNNTTVNSNLYVGGNVAVDNLVNYRGSTPLTLLANNVVSGSSGSPSIPHTFTLRGHSVDYNGNGSRLAGEGFLAFDSNVNWTGAQRRWAITNAYGIGINNAYSGNLTFLVGTDSNQTPSLGVNGALGTGTAIGMRIDGSGVIHARTGNSTNWNTAYGWGNHASAGYATSGANTYSGNQTAPRFVISDNSHILTTGHWAGAIRIEGSGTEPMYIGNHHKADLKLLTHNTPRLTIADNGNSTFSGDAFIHKSTPQLELKDTSNNTRGYIGINNGVLKVGSKDNVNLHFQTNGTDRGYFLANGTFTTLGAIYSGTHVPNSGGSYDLGTDSARWRNIHTNAIYVDGRNVTGGTIDQIGQGVGAYNWGNHAEAGYFKNGSLITGSGMTNSGSFTELNDLAITKKLYVAFDHGVANQKANIVIPNTHDSGRFWGEIIVTISSGYSHENASGSLKVCYALGLNHNGAQYTNSSMVMVSEGRTPYNFALDDAFRWDDTNKHWYLPLQHSRTTGNQAYIQLEAKATSPNYIENLQTAYVTSVYTTNTNTYPHRGYAYNNSFDIRGPNLLVGTYLNKDKTTNVAANANGITISGEHAPTLSLWDISSSGFHSHFAQIGSDSVIRSSGTFSLQVAGGTRAIRVNSDKSVTFDGSIQSVGNTYVSGALYTDSLNRQTGGSSIKVNSGLNITGTTNGTELYLSDRLMVSGSNSYMRLRDENNANQSTWEYTANEVRFYNNNAEDLWFGVNASKKLEINGSDGMVVSHSHHKFYNDIRTTIGRVRSYASNGAFTIMNADSGSWGVVQSRGINLGDWYRQPDYGQIAVGEYTFNVFKGNASSSSSILTVNQSGRLDTTTIHTSSYIASGSYLSVPTNNPIWLDGGSNTYIKESKADTISFVTGGNETLSLAYPTITAKANLTVSSNLYTNSIQHNTAGDMVIGNKAHDIRVEGGAFSVVSGTNVPMVRLMDSSYNIHGYLYATNQSEVGLLDADGQWGYVHKKDSHHQWRINNTQRMYLDNYQMDVYTNQFKIEGGNPRIIAKGDSNGYVNGAFVTSSKDGNRGGGLFMHDRTNSNEWFCGRPYSNNDQFIIARQTGIGDHSGTTAQESNASFKINNAGNVSIIASSPQTKYVNDSGTTLGYVFGNSNGFGLLADSGHWAYNITANSTKHTWSISNNTRLTLDTSELKMVGQVTANGGNSSQWNTAYGWGDHSKAGYQIGKSDIRLKTNISTIKTPLDKISKLRGVTFDWKEHTTKNTVDTGGGVIAQEVEEVMPELVHDIGNGSGMKTVDYNGLIGVLIESVKELKNEIETLKANCNCKGEK